MDRVRLDRLEVDTQPQRDRALLAYTLAWHSQTGERVVHESRRLSFDVPAHRRDVWGLVFDTTMTNVSGMDLPSVRPRREAGRTPGTAGCSGAGRGPSPAEPCSPRTSPGARRSAGPGHPGSASREPTTAVEDARRSSSSARPIRPTPRSGSVGRRQPRALLPVRVGVLTAWGALRSWTCSGHLRTWTCKRRTRGHVLVG